MKAAKIFRSPEIKPFQWFEKIKYKKTQNNSMKTTEIIPRLANVCKHFQILIENANENFDEGAKRHGGYLSILDKDSGLILMVIAIGTIPLEKAEKYKQLSIEKAIRLFNHKNHRTSWDSKNEKEFQYPGAIKGQEGIYSFSGHNPDVDEALAIAALYLIEPAGREQARFTSGLKFFRYYYDEVAQRNYFVRSFLNILKRVYDNPWAGIAFIRG